MSHINTITDAEITALTRDETTGLCEPTTVQVDTNGTPMGAYGYEYKAAGTTAVRGWGHLDGVARVWTHHSGAYSVLVQ